MVKIVMCTYNGEKYLQEQIDSIVENDNQDWELYVSDDGSTDHTLDILKYNQGRFPNKISYRINTDREGSALHFLKSIREVGKNMQDDDYLMLSDQDDVWKSYKIGKTLKCMERMVEEYTNDIPLLVCGDVEVVDENKKQISASFRKMNNYQIDKLDFSHLMMENKVQGCTVMINKAFVKELDILPKEVLMHDSWLGLIATTMGKICYMDTPMMLYRQHSNNVKGSTSYQEIIIKQLKNLSLQKYMVYNSIPQIREFIRIFGDRLTVERLNEAKAFVDLEKQGFFEKRKNIIKYHMWKTGFIRNIGLLVLI